MLAFFFFFEELEFVFFFSRENCSTKESVESKGNLANFFAAEFGHVNVLSLRRKPGVNQLVNKRTPKVDTKMWRQAREVSRAVSNKPEKGDTVACAFAENAEESFPCRLEQLQNFFQKNSLKLLSLY